jgi:hypothetical protein
MNKKNLSEADIWTKFITPAIVAKVGVNGVLPNQPFEFMYKSFVKNNIDWV